MTKQAAAGKPSTWAAGTVLAAALAGCGGDDGGPGGEPEPDTGATVSFFACVIADDGVGGPLDGVVWSVLDRPEIASAESDLVGCVELGGLPPNNELVLSFTKEGYAPRLRTIRTGDTDLRLDAPHEEWLVPASKLADFAAWSGQAIDFSAPYLGFFMRDANAAAAENDWLVDTTVDYEGPSSGTCYLPKEGAVDEGCATESNNLGVASIHNLAPGFLDVKAGPSGVDCVDELADTGWSLAWRAPEGANTFRVVLREGFETFASVDCAR